METKGFTLIELMLVIIIIGILASTTVLVVGPTVRSGGYQAKSWSLVDQVDTADKIFYSAGDRWAASVADLVDSGYVDPGVPGDTAGAGDIYVSISGAEHSGAINVARRPDAGIPFPGAWVAKYRNGETAVGGWSNEDTTYGTSEATKCPPQR